MGQKWAVSFTDAPQWGQVGLAWAAVLGSPHCLQKRTSGRSFAPQWKHVGVAAAGSALRHCCNAWAHCLQKRAARRLLVPHCGQEFTALCFRRFGATVVFEFGQKDAVSLEHDQVNLVALTGEKVVQEDKVLLPGVKVLIQFEQRFLLCLVVRLAAVPYLDAH